MKIAFFCFTDLIFSVDTAYQRPLGGSHSALGYLAEELARLGHQVALFANTDTTGLRRNVLCRPLAAAPQEDLRSYDAVIVLNNSQGDIIRALRRNIGPGPLLVLWTQHAPDQDAVSDLAIPKVAQTWDRIVFVSEWQRDTYLRRFDLPSGRDAVMRNGIAPAIADLFPPGCPIAAAKPDHPVLCYTSTPFRGLDVLLHAFPRIRARIPGAELKLYSSLQVYQVAAADDPFTALYDRARHLPGVEYVGALSQPMLAQALRDATALAYPNTFPETSCIAALEAMAAGCHIVTSDLGALPETTAGFGHLMAPPEDRRAFAEMFADRMVAVLHHARSEPAAAEAALRAQVDQVRRHHRWPVLARIWSDWLADAAAAKAAGRNLP